MAALKKQALNHLNERELMLIKLVCQEKTNAEIAKKMELSLRLTEKVKTSVYRKTKAKSLIGLFKWALLNGHYKLRGIRA